MTAEVIALIANSAISLLGIIITALISNAVTKYRIERLEKQVEKHNNVVDRVIRLEQKVEDIKT